MSTAIWTTSDCRKTVAARQQVVEREYEGYVAKDAASAYEGGPTRRWLKVKQKGWTVEGDRWRRRLIGNDMT